MARGKPGPTWEPGHDYVALHNVSNRNIMLHLPSGDLRLDAGHRVQMMKTALGLPQLQELTASGQVKVEA
ncbi:MAG TPA: hypothetical protein EYH31_02195 [Anaerolineae bacterium]|nr:hypothetical protein [Anaerolineae bacterium]